MVRKEPAASLGRRIGALGLSVLLLIGTLVIGYLVWSIFEWRHSRTPTYRLLGLRVATQEGAQPIGLARSSFRSAVLCTLLVVPTAVGGAVVLLCFAFGASPPDGLFSQPRRAPWDVLTGTTVLDERARPRVRPGPEFRPLDTVDLAGTTVTELPQSNGHTLN